MSMVRLSADEASRLVVDTLKRCRTSEHNARSVANALVEAELAGQEGHGLRRLPFYGAQALSGKVDGMAVPNATQTRPAALAIDAGFGFAFPAIDLALDWLPDAAWREGLAIAGVRRSHHSGVAGVPVAKLAEAGVIGLLMANAPASMAPWGSNRPLMGTDPIAFAAPLPGADPVVIDISLSKAARGKIMAARQKSEPIPEGWALDRDGNPTTDADAALAGTMVPMGDAKGMALALMVELLCAGLTGANYAYEASSFFNAEGDPPGTGQVLVAIDPAVFGTDAGTRFAEMADQVDAADGARLPGRRRQAIKRDLLGNGIPVDEKLLREIEELAR